MIKNLVFSGGGVKIYSFIGALKALDELNIIDGVESFLGCSTGSLISTLLCMGFTVSEIEKFLIKLDINKVKDLSSDNIFKFFETYGIDNGESMSRIIKIILKNKFNNENITFKELNKITKKKLIITTTCLNDMETQFFDFETTPDMTIVDSLLMSICVPILFTPRKYKDKLYVDGGLTSNYPIDYFNHDLKSTIGIMVSDNYNNTNEIKNITNYFYTLFKCPFKKVTKLIYELYKENTIMIESDINFIDFSIKYNTKISMIDEGYDITKKFLENTDLKLL